MTVVSTTCDACERARRCLRIETKRGHQIDLCRACLLEAMAAIDEAPTGRTFAERRRVEQRALTERLRRARRAVSA